MADPSDSNPAGGSPEAQRPPRHTSSKYDFVKVKVWLGPPSPSGSGEGGHYYVLSRFLVARMLTVTRIPQVVAIKLSLELKKSLVDRGSLDVSQEEMEQELFRLMGRRGYGEEYVRRYRFMTKFYHRRTPLIILIMGTACVGKSTIATQLAQRLNLPNVLQTDIVLDLLRSTGLAPVDQRSLWEREFESEGEMIGEFKRECQLVRKGLAGDLKKAVKDGKPIIIEGLHLDPASFSSESGLGSSLGNQHLHIHPEAQGIPPGTQDIPPESEAEEDSSQCTKEFSPPKKERSSLDSPVLRSGRERDADRGLVGVEGAPAGSTIQHTKGTPQPNETRPTDESRGPRGGWVRGEELPTAYEGGGWQGPQGSSFSSPIVVPIVLEMESEDRKVLLPQWRHCWKQELNHSGEESLAAAKISLHALSQKMMVAQNYLTSPDRKVLLESWKRQASGL